MNKKFLRFVCMIWILGYALMPRAVAQADVVFNYTLVDGNGPQDIWLKTVGDVNGDGQLDLIAGGYTAGGLVWYESPAWTKRTIDSGSGFSTDGEVVDLDGDGDQDVLTLGGPRWYENPSWTSHLIDSRELHDVEVSDFDGDGDVDLVARNQSAFGGSGSELHFYRQEGPMSWTHRVVNSVNGEGLALADVDGDGDEDVVLNGVWLENTQEIVNGGWTSYAYTSSWTHPHTFVGTGDLNGDGRLDMVLAPAEAAGGRYRLSWFAAPVNPKSGNWVETIVENDIETVQHFVGVADFDRDGDQDIAAAEMEQGGDPDEVKVYSNQDGVGGSWSKQVLATTGSHSMRIVDIGNDGDPDLYGANWEGNQVEIWVNQVNGSSASTTTATNPVDENILTAWGREVIDGDHGVNQVFVLPGDLDGDGDPDVASGSSWYQNPGSIHGSWTKSPIGAAGFGQVVLVQDLDGDGDPDLLGNGGGGSFAWAQNNGAGSFSLHTNIPPGQGDFLQGVAVGDFGGGALEIALSWHEGGPGIQVLTVPSDPVNTPWSLRQLTTSGGQAVTSQAEALSAADIDRDGDTDLLLGTIWLERDGSSWTERALTNPPGSPDRNQLADINQDGRLDAVVGYEAISVPGKLAWYEQPGMATDLWSEHEIAVVVGPMSLDVEDMDGDGDLDVVVGEHNLSDPASARLLVFENTDGGGGAWSEHLVYTGDEHHDGAQTADFDADGDLDIVSIGWQNPRVTLYENLAQNASIPDETLMPRTPTTPSTPTTDVVPRSASQDIITIGETEILTTDDSGNGNLLVAQETTLSAHATIQSLSFYVTTADGHLRLGIYDATGPNGGPGKLKAQTPEFTPRAGWNTQNVETPTELYPGTYWLAYLPESSRLGFRLAGDGSAHWYGYDHADLPDTYSTEPMGGAYHWSFYATLSTGSAPSNTLADGILPCSAGFLVLGALLLTMAKVRKPSLH